MWKKTQNSWCLNIYYFLIIINDVVTYLLYIVYYMNCCMYILYKMLNEIIIIQMFYIQIMVVLLNQKPSNLQIYKNMRILKIWLFYNYIYKKMWSLFQAGSWVVNRGCNWIGMGMLRATMQDETWCDEMWLESWDVIQYYEMRCDKMLCDEMRYDEMWWDAIWWDVMRCHELWWDAMPWDVTQSKMGSFTGACAYFPIIGCWNLAELLEGWGRVF